MARLVWAKDKLLLAQKLSAVFAMIFLAAPTAAHAYWIAKQSDLQVH